MWSTKSDKNSRSSRYSINRREEWIKWWQDSIPSTSTCKRRMLNGPKSSKVQFSTASSTWTRWTTTSCSRTRSTLCQWFKSFLTNWLRSLASLPGTSTNTSVKSRLTSISKSKCRKKRARLKVEQKKLREKGRSQQHTKCRQDIWITSKINELAFCNLSMKITL